MSERVEPQKTPLYQAHIKAGANMTEFSGFLMPIRYSGGGDKEEHFAVRQRVGLFDVSHMGRFAITEQDAVAFLDSVTTNDVSRLGENRAQYSLMCNENGGVVDDVLVYNRGSEMLMVVNAGNRGKDFEWLEGRSDGFDVRIWDESEETALLALQGPKALSTLVKMTKEPVGELRAFGFMEASVGGIATRVSRTGYTGEDGFELWFDSIKAEKMWDMLLDEGEEFGIMPCGLGARNTLRLEAALSLYGHEINDEINPLEAGLSRWVKLDKESDFVGKSVLTGISEQGLKRRLVGFKTPGLGRTPREEARIFDGDREVGFVASGVVSPTFGDRIGTGYVPVELADVGRDLMIPFRGSEPVVVKVTELPFYRKVK